MFKTKSSEELAHLTDVVEWAKAARLARVTGTRLVPVKKNAALADKPLDLVLSMLAAYPKLGKALFPRNKWRNSMVGDEFADLGHELLTALLASQGTCRLATLIGTANDMIEARYLLSGLTQQQHDSLQRMIAVDVAIAMAALHLLGVVVLDRSADRDPDEDSAELTELGRYAIRRLRGMAQAGDPLLQVRITLADVEDPPVWNAFRIGEETYGLPDLDSELGYLDERKFRLGDLTAGRISYEYDFGDGWEHELVIEERTTAGAEGIYPVCIAGGGACPPEDCGGSPGFAEFKALLAGPPSTERDEMLQWAGGEYDPSRFNLAAASAAVTGI